MDTDPALPKAAQTLEPTASGAHLRVIEPPPQPAAAPSNQGLGKFAPFASVSIVAVFLALFWQWFATIVQDSREQNKRSLEQIERLFEQVKDQHTLDRSNATEQRTEDRKIRREELDEQRRMNEKLWTFARELQLTLVEDSQALKQLVRRMGGAPKPEDDR